IIIMSDSRFEDARRFAIIESVKRRVLRLVSAALVAGRQQVAYLRTLGFPADRIFTGYDVVDNSYFARGAAEARQNEESLRQKLGLTRPFFLCCARFVPKKNLTMLVEAYHYYRSVSSSFPWDLVIAGDGEMRKQIQDTIAKHELQAHCKLLGHQH